MNGPAFYRGNGLLIRSDIALPEYNPCTGGTPDAVIETSDAAKRAATRAEPQTWEYGGFQTSPDGPVLVVPDIASFLITQGRHIAVSPMDGADPGMVKLYLMGSAMGMLFHQRGQLILHGAAVLPGTGAPDPGISLFTGPSGAGKSTLSAHLAQLGHAVLGDDTLPLISGEAAAPVAWPGARVFKLCTDAVARLPGSSFSTVAEGYEKVFVENQAPAPDRPTPLREIMLLERGEGPARLEPVNGLQAVAVIAGNTYRPEYLRMLGAEARHFEQVTQLITHVRVYRLTRPWDSNRMADVLDLLARHWRQGSA